jgi:hypothetical protein
MRGGSDGSRPQGVAQNASTQERRTTLTIGRSEKFYPDRGTLETDPPTDVPRANLASVQQLVQLGRQPRNTMDTADRKCDHAVIRVRHHADPSTNTAKTSSSRGGAGCNIF